MKNIFAVAIMLVMFIGIGDLKAGDRNNFEWEMDDENGNEPFMLSYNRVEGFFFGFGVPKEFKNSFGMNNRLTFYGFWGYGLSNGKSSYRAGLTRKFFGSNSFELGAELFDLTYSEDLWVIPRKENSVTALFFHEDYLDYYRKNGSSVYGIQNFGGFLKIEGGYVVEKHADMSVEQVWSLFRQGEKFRENTQVAEGTFKNTYLIVRTGNSRFLRNWDAELQAEWNSSLFEDEMPNYERYIISLSRYQPLGRNDDLKIRLRYGTTNGSVPVQKKFDLGGKGTLRGYKYKEFQNGDKMALINVEYSTNGKNIDGLGFLPNFDDYLISFFIDAGVVWSDRRDLPDLSDVNRNIGVGFGSKDEGFRVNFSKPLDGPEDERGIVMAIRFNKMF
ncbi:MAG: BamA/TamA family outer membrane protein [Candidatus Marinimicrobia bacterium]|nr:BamA/TamA family outer membrane protein [Candidatus Neomarinimicrobiota bacterium]